MAETKAAQIVTCVFTRSGSDDVTLRDGVDFEANA